MSSTNYYTSSLLAPSSNRMQREIPAFGNLARQTSQSVEEEKPVSNIFHSRDIRENRVIERREERTKTLASNVSPTKTDREIGEESADASNSSAANPQSNASLPSYTAMIAQAILSKEGHRSTLSDIYEYMNKSFPALERRGTGWRNCVRHTLSLNDCFIKLHRPENGRSCNWAVHPTYFESFSRGDYRKRRSIRKRARSLPWLDPTLPYPVSYLREQEYLQHQPSTWQLSPSSTPSWNPQQAYYNQAHAGFNQPLNISQDYRQQYYNNSHSSCHYMDPNCYCFNQKGNNRFLP